MRCYLVEIPMPLWQATDGARAMGSLLAAQSRLARMHIVVRVLAVTQREGHIACLIQAGSDAEARRLVALSLLPAGRVYELPGCLDPRGGKDGSGLR